MMIMVFRAFCFSLNMVDIIEGVSKLNLRYLFPDSGVIISMLASGAVDSGFEPRSCQTL
jgi:hypothetical protein